MELPASFITYTRTLLGDEAYDRFAAALDGEQPVSIRLNHNKLPVEGKMPDSSEPVPWCSSGLYLDRRLTFTFDPLFHAGAYYVQEAASMFLEQALKQYVGTEPVTMLDLCAAPGGKSTLARSVLPEGSLLVANEIMRNRAQVLAENLTKWGDASVVVTNNEPAAFTPLQNFFDIILTDVPCSGEGMFRKDAVAISEWSEANVELCRARQRDILTDIWGCLKPGGLLIYSTCTYNTKENEENVRWIADELGAEVLPLAVSNDWNITGNLLPDNDFPVYRFLPHKTRGEGLFMAVLRKTDVSSLSSSGKEKYPKMQVVGKRKKTMEKSKSKSISPTFSKDQLFQAVSWLQTPESYDIQSDGTMLTSFPKVHADALALLRSNLHVIHAGIPLAEGKGRDLIPSHALAMSTALRSDAFPRSELTYDQAIAYLRKEAVILSANTPRGFVLVTHKGLPLGFVKNIGNRANNLYPQEWRIRSGYQPEEVAVLID